MLKRILCNIVIALVILCIPHHSYAGKLPDSFADLVEKLMPAVVNISSTQKIKQQEFMRKLPVPQLPPGSPFEDFQEFFDQLDPNQNDGGEAEREALSLGSGVIIDPDGYIVTNTHVIADAEEITVKFSDDTQADAIVIGRDPKTDLALLKVDVHKKLPYVSFGDSDNVRVGDWVLAIGNPFGLGGSVTSGIISARARDINAGPFDDFLQTDAAINKGNSGGPMFNMDGKVIGINTAIYSPSGGSVGVGFAVPSSLAEPVIKQLKKHGRTFRGWLGVKIQTVTEDIAESIELKKEEGALVVEVTKESPADTAGIIVGDIILEFDHHPIATMRKLPRLVAEAEIGKVVDVIIWRKGEKKTVQVTLGELKEEDPKTTVSKSDETLDAPVEGTIDLMGMTIVTMNDELRARYGVTEDIKEGILVISVDEKGSAIRKGIRKGDVLTSVNQTPLANTDQLKSALEQAKKEGRKFMLLLVNRAGETIFMTLPVTDKEEKKGKGSGN